MRLLSALFAPAVLVLAGCLTAQNPDVGPSDLGPDFAVVEVPIRVHIVTVGVEPGVVDEDELRARLPAGRQPLVESVSGTTGTPTYQALKYTFTYTLHEAPAAFADELFRFALSTAVPGRPNAWLVEYDNQGPNRLCGQCQPFPPPEPDDVLYLDALKTEQWVADHRAEHGLGFGPGSVTIFLFDGEAAGAFPTDTYHYWRFDDGHGHSKVPRAEVPPGVEAPMEALGPVEAPPFHTPKDPISLRAWGGRWDFVWLDLTAAPSNYDFTPRRPAESWTDPPLWDVRDDPGARHDNLGRDLSDLLQIRVARDPIYPTRPFERFVTPIHVFIEPGALENPQTALGVDLEAWVPQDEIEASLRRLMPWVEVSAPVMFHYLPDDDPGMFDALALAKRYGDPTLVSAGVVKAYVRDAWDRYAPAPAPGDFVIPQFYFYFNGFYTFWGVSTAGGWADGDAWGNPWAIYNHFFDLCLRTNTIPCSKATLGFNNITMLPLHEAGHELGLTHTKDSVNLDPASWPEGHTNWLWDSTYSLMSYRHVYMEFDHFDRMFLAIAHSLGHLERAHACLLMLADPADAPDALAAYHEARALLAEGAYVEAVEAAKAAARLAQEAYLAEAGPSHDMSMMAGPTSGMDASGPRPEVVIKVRLVVPASETLIGSPNLGVAVVPNPVALDLPGATYASHTFDVPADAPYVRLKYWDADPGYAGTFKTSYVRVLGPDGSYRGGMGESFEDEVYLTSHWRGAGPHEVRVYQVAGTPGIYELEIGVGKPDAT